MTGVRPLSVLFTALALLALALRPGAFAATGNDLENRVKAAFLYNFVKFVEWPETKFEALHSPIELCVHDADGFGAVLRDTVRGKTAQGRPLVVHSGGPISNPRSCHLLYVADGSLKDVETIFARVNDASVLSVHAASEAVPDGIARFYLDNNKVRIEINAAAAERADLRLNPKLQSVATIVRR